MSRYNIAKFKVQRYKINGIYKRVQEFFLNFAQIFSFSSGCFDFSKKNVYFFLKRKFIFLRSVLTSPLYKQSQIVYHFYMNYIIFVTSFFTVSYSILIVYYNCGFIKNKSKDINLEKQKANQVILQKTNQVIPPTITLLVVCRNEEDYLPQLLNSIENQIVLPTKIILINDHSTDKTEDLLSSFAAKYNNVVIHKANGLGKKQGIKEGLQFVDTDYIMFTDADCILSKSHCKIAFDFLSKNNSDMLIGGVNLYGDKSIFLDMQKIEYASLQSSTAGSALNHSSIMCNGANLVVRSSEYINRINDINFKENSGDDMFILHSMKRDNKKIEYIIDSEYIVYTRASKSISEFINQRLRWASKSYSYNDLFTTLSAINIATINIVIILLILISIFNSAYLYLLLVIFIIKCIVDLSLIATYENRLNIIFTQNKFILFLLTTILYPFYSSIIAITSLFYRLLGKHKSPHWR